MLSDERHDVLFVGYQAEGTIGRHIQRFGPRGGYVEMDGQRYAIRSQVHTMSGYSAHADQQGLVGFVTKMRYWPSQVRIVHGVSFGQAGACTSIAYTIRAGMEVLRVIECRLRACSGQGILFF